MGCSLEASPAVIWYQTAGQNVKSFDLLTVLIVRYNLPPAAATAYVLARYSQQGMRRAFHALASIPRPIFA